MKIFKNKRVIFVGPSSILKGSKYGSTIDSYDIVVRTNGGWPVPEELKEDYGTRCDAIFINHVYSQSEDITDKLLKNPVKYIFHFLESPIDLSIFLPDSTFISMNQYSIQRQISEYSNIKFKENESPFGGMYLICTVLNDSPLEFKICSITNYGGAQSNFYLEGYLPKDFDSANINAGHNSRHQYIYISKLVREGKITFEEITKKYLGL